MKNYRYKYFKYRSKYNRLLKQVGGNPIISEILKEYGSIKNYIMEVIATFKKTKIYYDHIPVIYFPEKILEYIDDAYMTGIIDADTIDPRLLLDLRCRYEMERHCLLKISMPSHTDRNNNDKLIHKLKHTASIFKPDIISSKSPGGASSGTVQMFKDETAWYFKSIRLIKPNGDIEINMNIFREVFAYELCKLLNLDLVPETKLVQLDISGISDSMLANIPRWFSDSSFLFGSLQRDVNGSGSLSTGGKFKIMSSISTYHPFERTIVENEDEIIRHDNWNELVVFGFLLGGYDCNLDNTFIDDKNIEFRCIDNEFSFERLLPYEYEVEESERTYWCSQLPNFYSASITQKIIDWWEIRASLRDALVKLDIPEIEVEAFILRLYILFRDCLDKSRLGLAVQKGDE